MRVSWAWEAVGAVKPRSNTPSTTQANQRAMTRKLAERRRTSSDRHRRTGAGAAQQVAQQDEGPR